MTQKSASSRPFRVAVDAVGGDYAPQEVVKGAIEAAREDGATVFLVGPPEKVEPELKKHDIQGLSVHLVPSEDAVKEGEQPALALRRSPRASVLVATSLVKQGQADAVVSMGSTGALMASAAILLGHIEGIERPVLGGPFLGYAPTMVCLDMGSNVDCRPAQFVDFAAIGTAFCREYLEVPNPTVALLNVGSEEGKGSRQIKEAYALLKASKLNFIGNIEAHEILADKANVVLW
ncbi:MAG: phosphate--acyl-ACP acyltransferase, partial [Chloroflexi bacterium]|nr:phosphate--acyl-ACP acyltransferase [Chloroflexota bacterium]